MNLVCFFQSWFFPQTFFRHFCSSDEVAREQGKKNSIFHKTFFFFQTSADSKFLHQAHFLDSFFSFFKQSTQIFLRLLGVQRQGIYVRRENSGEWENISVFLISGKRYFFMMHIYVDDIAAIRGRGDNIDNRRRHDDEGL